MKKILLIALLVSSVTVPAMAAVTIAGSKHDMIASGFATPSGGAATEICIFCHTPHGAQTSVTQAPLWNNTASANIVASGIYNSYAVINGVSMKSFTVSEAQINATDARLCLACHDSGIGMPVNLPNVGSIDPALAMDANALLGTDLSNDHPIGMDLGGSPNTTDPGIRTLADIRGALIGFGEDPFYGGDPNDNINIMWCSSCHDVHDSDPLTAPFLRISNVGSALCKACHKK
jgi:predicted CXXCH cytochrome family protein